MAFQDDEEEKKNPYVMSGSAPDLMTGGLTPGTSDQVAPAPAPSMPKTINQDGKQYTFTPGPNGSLTAPAPSHSNEIVPQRTLPGMPPGVSPDEIEKYISGQRGQVAKYGAPDQMALQERINFSKNSLPYQVADAGKGFADALMTGVARAGNPNWQGQFEQQQNEAGNQNLQTMRGANEANLKQTEAGMSLDKLDANSVLSKASQQNYAPLFQKLGYPPNAIGKMSAANIENALGLMSEYGGKEIEAQIKAAEMQLEGKKLDATLANIDSESQNREQQQKINTQKQRQENLQDLAKMPWYSRVMHPEISKTLEQNAGLGDYSPDVMAYADKHSITPDQALKIKRTRPTS